MSVSRGLLVLLGAFGLFLSAGPARADAHFAFVGGLKSMESEWDDPELIGRLPYTIGAPTDADLSDQIYFGLMTSIGDADWPVEIAVDFLFAFSSGEEEVVVEDPLGNDQARIEIEAGTIETHVGVRKWWDSGPRSIFLGGGLGIFLAERTETDRDDVSLNVEDEAFGLWVDCGMTWRVASKWSVGLELRYSHAQVDLFDDDLDAGGVHLGILAGRDW